MNYEGKWIDSGKIKLRIITNFLLTKEINGDILKQ